ncbi:MAG TPA: PIN domain-containing protein [Salinimicrobium sp.]|nr:PIN domain-containing protein [Salinimicrobium sp.]
MKQRFYLDTSVFGGVFDKGFDEATLQLFERIKLGEITCIYSELTKTELVNAPKRVQSFFIDLPKISMEKVEITDEILALAAKYVEEKVVGETSLDDCIHIATATVHRADILVSWSRDFGINTS